MFADYYVHTYYGDDSETPMETQVERAISLGLEEICFTDHVDYGIKRDWDDPWIMEYRKGGPGEPERMALANVKEQIFAEVYLFLSKTKFVAKIKQNI